MIDRRSFLATAGATAAALTFGSRAFAQSGGVGVLIPGAVNDRGFNESAYVALKRLEAKLGGKVPIQIVENINMADAEQALIQLAQKYGLVATVSGAMQRSMLAVAKKFPHRKFLLIAGTNLVGGETNVAQYNIRQAENGYVVGAAAALLSKTGVLSIVGGVELPTMVNASKEFNNGAQAVRPGARVITTFTGSWDDVSKAKEATLANASSGADVHLPIQRNGLLGVEQGGKESKTRLIGVWTARCGVDPVYVGFSVIGIGYMLTHGIEQFLAGQFKPGSLAFGFRAGPQASDVVVCSGETPEITATLNRLKQDIIAGKITTLDG